MMLVLLLAFSAYCPTGPYRTAADSSQITRITGLCKMRFSAYPLARKVQNAQSILKKLDTCLDSVALKFQLIHSSPFFKSCHSIMPSVEGLRNYMSG
jgi:hypothetical protein